MTISCPGSRPRLAQHRTPSQQWSVLAAALMLTVCVARPSVAQVTIFVTTTQQGVTNGQCSLQEAIYSSEFKMNTAISSTDPDTFYTTRCVPGTGKGDTIVLPPGAVFSFDHFWDGDSHNPYGPTATPIIFSTITIEGNGATLQWVSTFFPGNSRLFAIGQVNDAGFASGTGDVVLRNVYIKGFHIKGGDGGMGGGVGGGGGLGAGGAIYVQGSHLTVENSTFENNGAVGGNGGASGLAGDFAPGLAGGGGGLSGNGGGVVGIIGPLLGSVPCYAGSGGGGGSRGDGGSVECGDVQGGGGGGGGGTVFSGGDPSSDVGASGGFLCGGNGGDAGNNGHPPACPGAGGGGGGIHGDGAPGSYGGGGGGGGGDGGGGGFGGGGGAGYNAIFILHGGNGGFGGGGGAAPGAFLFGSHPGKGGHFGGRADGNNGGGGGALGGAIFSDSSQLRVHNSTFYNNYVTRGVAGGGSADNGGDAGGAIFAYDNWPLEITYSTFSGNQSTGSGAAIVDYGEILPGVVYPGGTNFLLLNDTIIANNGANECFFTGSINAGGVDNLIMNNGVGTGPFSPCPGVVSTSDPQLGPLQLNSPGNTPTMAISLNSPALNSADPETSLPTDQRGVARPQLRPDIGAFERRLDER
jgi:hypothetical protein